MSDELMKMSRDMHQQVMNNAPNEFNRNTGCLIQLLVMLLGFCAHYAPATLGVYLALPVLGWLAVVGKSWLFVWYASIPDGTISLTPFTESHFLPAVLYSVGLSLLALVSLACAFGGVLGAVAGLAFGTWFTRVLGVYYLFSLSRAVHYQYYQIQNDQPFKGIFWGCFLASVVVETVATIIKRRRRQNAAEGGDTEQMPSRMVWGVSALVVVLTLAFGVGFNAMMKNETIKEKQFQASR